MHITYILFLVLFLAGCAAGTKTTDPRKGGLFSYNPEAYQKRLDQRKAQRSYYERDTYKQRQVGSQLNKNLAAEKRQLALLKVNLSSLDDSLNALQRRINNTASSKQSRMRKQQILQKIKKTKKEIWRVQHNVGHKVVKIPRHKVVRTSHTTIRTATRTNKRVNVRNEKYLRKKREYDRLKKQRDLLVKEAELLERM